MTSVYACLTSLMLLQTELGSPVTEQGPVHPQLLHKHNRSAWRSRLAPAASMAAVIRVTQSE